MAENNGGGWKSWALGLAVTVAVGALTFGWSSNATRLDHVQHTQQARGERIAKMEAEMIALHAQLARIERKLDMALERK